MADPLSFEALASSEHVLSSAENFVLYVLLEAIARGAGGPGGGSRLPLNLGVVIDRSGSMYDERRLELHPWGDDQEWASVVLGFAQQRDVVELVRVEPQSVFERVAPEALPLGRRHLGSGPERARRDHARRSRNQANAAQHRQAQLGAAGAGTHLVFRKATGYQRDRTKRDRSARMLRRVGRLAPLRSGLGRESGQEMIKEYLQVKSVWISTATDVPNPFVIR